MELADHVVILADGEVEQAGSPDELYDRPANEFVMKFIGEVTRLGDQIVRPHDIQVLREPGEGAIEALVERVVRLGFEVRLELAPADSEPISAQLSAAEAEALELEAGQIVYVRLGTAGRTELPV
jgi:sulfate transport system ATP-binding protein